MKINFSSKNIVLFVLFVVPFLFYIYLQISTHNFVKLPVRVKQVTDISNIDKSCSFKNNVSVVVFLGASFDKTSAELFNLNEKVYKKFYGYPDFQLVLLLPKGTEDKVNELKTKTKLLTNTQKMKFVFVDSKQIELIHYSFGSSEPLDKDYHCKQAFIIDKENNLRRGKSESIESAKKLGYDMTSVSELKKEMQDDVKILLAEYRFALKKNGQTRRKI